MLGRPAFVRRIVCELIESPLLRLRFAEDSAHELNPLGDLIGCN